MDNEFVLVSGMSGAGRSSVANVMEDLGWYVVDNLPPQLILNLVDLAQHASRGRRHTRVAAVVDVRARDFFSSLNDAVTQLRERGSRPDIVFLDATDEALVRRFESVRRPHPLQGEGRLLDGIQAEREMLAELRAGSSIVIDTSGLNVHQLSRKVVQLLSGTSEQRTRLAVLSFGFKYGVPLDADFVFDLRFLPNPFWVPELRPLTGIEEPVANYVLGQPGAREFLDQVVALMETVAAGYQREGRSYVTVAVGCTGGKHRSVAIAEQLSERLSSEQSATFVVHRDLGRE